MLNPIERPPPSFAPRLAASITPGPPPVTTPSPACANRRAVSRAASYVAEPSATRAEDRHGGPVDPLHFLEPGEELGSDQRDVARDGLVRAPQEEAVVLRVGAH